MANDYYPPQQQRGITPIEDILDPDQSEMVSRKIRHHMRKEIPRDESLLDLEGPYPPSPPGPQHNWDPNFMGPPPPSPPYLVERIKEERISRGINPGDISCKDIAEHIKNCEICSKIYNTDKTLYIIAIVILIIICIYLLKRILQL